MTPINQGPMQSQAPAASSSGSIDILDSLNDSVMRGQASQGDYSFAQFDIADYVSNGEDLDLFADPGSSQQPPAAHGNSAEMMTEALVRQLQEMHSPSDRRLVGSGQPQQQMSEQHGLATPMSLMHADMSSGPPGMHRGASSGPVTPIAVGQPNSVSDPTTELLKEQLSKQLQLQRLQHLQNQLLQQQVRDEKKKIYANCTLSVRLMDVHNRSTLSAVAVRAHSIQRASGSVAY